MGVDTLIKLIDKSNFPWLLSNMFDIDPTHQLIPSKVKVVVELNGLRV